MIYYEPSLEDVIPNPYVDEEYSYHYPWFVIKYLRDNGYFEEALIASKVKRPTQPMLSKKEYDEIIKAFARREALEADKAIERVEAKAAAAKANKTKETPAAVT
jgi:hypothetical protein